MTSRQPAARFALQSFQLNRSKRRVAAASRPRVRLAACSEELAIRRIGGIGFPIPLCRWRLPRLCGFPRRNADVHCSKAIGVVLSSGLASSFESCPVEPGRCAAAHRQLSWTLRLYSTCWAARATIRRCSTIACVAPSGFGYPLDALLPRTPAPRLFQPGSAHEIRREAMTGRDCTSVSARRGPPVVFEQPLFAITGIAPLRLPSTSGPTHRDLPLRPDCECLTRRRRSRSALCPFREIPRVPCVRPFARSSLTLGQFGKNRSPASRSFAWHHS